MKNEELILEVCDYMYNELLSMDALHEDEEVIVYQQLFDRNDIACELGYEFDEIVENTRGIIKKLLGYENVISCFCDGGIELTIEVKK